MEVKIFYCNSWVNFLTKASSVEDELNKNFPSAKVSKEVGEKGGFKVEADGKLIYDYNSFPRPKFPDNGEITATIIRKFNL